MKSLDDKLAKLHADPAGADDFILADAKDADMAFGLERSRDRSPNGYTAIAGRLPRPDFAKIVSQGLVDIMLMSASTSELLTVGERLFHGTAVTPAVARERHDRHSPARRRRLSAAALAPVFAARRSSRSSAPRAPIWGSIR